MPLRDAHRVSAVVDIRPYTEKMVARPSRDKYF